MKTPKEEAEALRDKFYYEGNLSNYEQAVKCAIIAVEMIVKELFEGPDDIISAKRLKYWQKVLNHLKQM